MAETSASQARLIEKVEILDGSRNRQSRHRAAVRVEDLRHLTALSARPRAKKAQGPSVTVDEYNALVDDIAALYESLGATGAILRAKDG